MRTQHFLPVFLLILIACSSPSLKEENDNLLNADQFLIDQPQTEVMLLGTWHFAYPNNDSFKVDKADQVNFESDKKQREIKQAVQGLQKFNPSIICIESMNQKKIDSLYQLYLDGQYKLSISEDEQIGFRMAKNLGHKKIYAVDSYGWLRDNYKDYPALDHLWDEQYYLDTLEMMEWGKKYEKFYTYADQVITKKTVDECLKYFNRPENIKRRLGHYLVEMKTSNHNGPDSFALKWYDRNVRIFNNILKTNPKPTDKILVIFGVSHISILEQLFDVSPQFKLQRPYAY